jgi:hypothetical protein
MLNNALNEVIGLGDYFFSIEAASIQFKQPDGNFRFINLKKGHSTEEFNAFCETLNFEYDARVKGQVFGTIWFTDGTWAERGGDDSLVCWEHHSKSEIPVDSL